MSVTAPPSVPAKTISRYSGTPELLDDPGHVVGLNAQTVPIVDRDDSRPAAAAEALDRPERELAVLRRRARRDSELALERLEHLLRARETAGHVGAHLDARPAARLEVVLVVERGDREAVGG